MKSTQFIPLAMFALTSVGCSSTSTEPTTAGPDMRITVVCEKTPGPTDEIVATNPAGNEAKGQSGTTDSGSDQCHDKGN